MSKSVLLGAIDNLSWTDIKPWAMSARESGFDGDMWLITYRVNDNYDLSKFCDKYGINEYHVEHDALGQPIQHAVPGSPTVAHTLRFYHFWELMHQFSNEMIYYDWCLATDVRDVIFQKNPIHYLEKRKADRAKEGHILSLLASSEGIIYENEEWGRNNILQGFGKLAWEVAHIGRREIYNVGVLSGHVYDMRKLFLDIYNYTHGRQYYPSDQSSYNYIIGEDLSGAIEFAQHDDGWACQCGTTCDPTKSFLWPRLNTRQPIIKNGEAFTSKGELFTVVHQWDRNPELKQAIKQRYV